MTAITKSESTSLSTDVLSRIDLAIAGWLDAKGGLSGSAKTRKAYADTLNDFRAVLTVQGLDLDAGADALALVMQAWAGLSKVQGRAVSPATYNQRVAIISSFFDYARKHHLIDGENPADRVERRKVQAYGGAKGLNAADVQKHLKRIDRASVEGARDYALLVTGLETGRRAAELAGLRWRDVLVQDGRVILSFRRLKGGKVGTNTLSAKTSKALLSYLYAEYGARLGTLPADAPIWVSRARVNAGAAISTQTIADICMKRLGVSRVHALRHTSAVAGRTAGESIEGTAARLGHSNIATTSRYLEALTRNESKFADAIADVFGVGD